MASIASVDARLVDELLYSREGVDLDFKRDQYPYEGAADSAISIPPLAIAQS
jgi:hypothetical protein